MLCIESYFSNYFYIAFCTQEQVTFESTESQFIDTLFALFISAWPTCLKINRHSSREAQREVAITIKRKTFYLFRL